MDLIALQPMFSTLWVVWFFVLFAGILFYVLSPKRRRDYERAGDIPFRDDARDRLS
jgi:cytochrome c oxidase cbb3-type subunit 4